MTLQRRSFHVARQSYRCERCAGRINPGERYMVAVLAPGGELGNAHWWRIRECDHCIRALGREEAS